MASSNEEKEEAEAVPNSIHDLKDLMHDTKVGNKSLWSVALETMGFDIDGKTKKADIMATTDTEALRILKEVIEMKKKEEESKKENEKGNKNKEMGQEGKKNKWDLPWTPLKEFNATRDDILIAFCKWAKKKRKDEDEEEEIKKGGEEKEADDATTTATMNVSRAFRRLENYVNWMEDNQDILKEPLTVDSITSAAKIFRIQNSHDRYGRRILWVDISQVDRDALKDRAQMSVTDMLRYMVWLSHLAMLDPSAQEHGSIIIENCANAGFRETVTAVPLDVRTQLKTKAKLDRLTIGCLPIKLKKIYMMDSPSWVNILFYFAKPFMSKKIRQRIVIIGRGEKDDTETMINDIVGGRENIPSNFSGCEGTLEQDIIFGTYVKESIRRGSF